MRFYAIMHSKTIVQNKIINIICSCHFLCLANIYRPGLGKVRLGWPNPKTISGAQFLSQKKQKKLSTQNYVNYNTKLTDFQFLFLFIFKKIF